MYFIKYKINALKFYPKCFYQNSTWWQSLSICTCVFMCDNSTLISSQTQWDDIYFLKKLDNLCIINARTLVTVKKSTEV